jgi:phosphopantothenate-cysteine ligase
MKVMITAGCTVEKIDSIRSITNISTGKLGSLIANTFELRADIHKIYYLCNKSAVLPQSEKASVVYVDSVANLENTIVDIVNRVDIDIIVHSMAVSDYRIKTVTSLSNIERALNSESEIKSITSKTGKLSSDIDDLALLMERTPKIISMFQKISSHSVLVGFKLMDSVPRETLIDTGYCILRENKCCFVLANDLRDISENHHIGYLIDGNKNFTKHDTKKEIAAAIVAATIEKRRNNP